MRNKKGGGVLVMIARKRLKDRFSYYLVVLVAIISVLWCQEALLASQNATVLSN